MLNQASLTIRLHPDDDVVIARAQLVGGTRLIDEKVTVSGLVPPGHKVATRALEAGAPVRRYNQIIGFASKDIAPGEHVHLHNLAMGRFERDYAFGADAKPTEHVPNPATFMGIVRRDGPNAGKVATRNYIGILSTVNCSATVARGIAGHFTRERLAAFPNVDGVVAFVHGTGCGMAGDGDGFRSDRPAGTSARRCSRTGACGLGARRRGAGATCARAGCGPQARSQLRGRHAPAATRITLRRWRSNARHRGCGAICRDPGGARRSQAAEHPRTSH